MTKKLFEPREVDPQELGARQRSPEERAVAILEGAGIAKKFVPIIMAHLPLLEPIGQPEIPGEPPLVQVARQIAKYGESDDDRSEIPLAHFAHSASYIYRFIRDRARSDALIAALRLLFQALSAAGADFEGALPHLVRRPQGASIPAIAKGLWEVGAIDVRSLISIEHLRESATERGAFPKTWSSNRERAAQQDPTRLLYWLYANVWCGVEAALELLKETKDDEIAVIAKGVLWDIGCWAWSTGKQSEDYAHMGPYLQPIVEQLFQFLYDRAKAKPALLEPLFVEDLFRTAWIAYDEREQEMSAEVRGFLVALAKKELGRVRVELAKQPAETAGAFIETHVDHIRAAAHALFSLSTLWDGMKPLLLLVRASKIPLFGHDLSWWTTVAPMENNGVASLAQHFMYFFIAYSRFAQNSDEELADFRRELANFCLERLKTNKKGDGPNEPNALWRVAAIRAAGELGVNPDGKGHHLLHHARTRDKDEAVKSAADVAYQRMVDAKGLPRDVPPQKAVLNALWWLRQAQHSALDVEIDERGAQITRAQEIRFTTLKKYLPGEGITDNEPRKENP